jgi:hypothetical protein
MCLSQNEEASKLHFAKGNMVMSQQSLPNSKTPIWICYNLSTSELTCSDNVEQLKRNALVLHPTLFQRFLKVYSTL